MSGQRCEFTIATKDSYGNRCSLAGDKFAVAVRPTQSLVKELDPYMKKYEVVSDVTDNEDGTHTVGYQVEYAGFYRLDVTQHSQKCLPPWRRLSSAPAPPQGAPGGSGRLGSPRGRETTALGTQPLLPRLLEPAASKAADSTAVDLQSTSTVDATTR